MATGSDDGGFLSRWSRRKVQVRQGEVPVDPPPPVAPVAPAALAGVATPAPADPAPPAAPAAPAPAPPPPAPTFDDVALLGRDSDYTRFVAPGVDSGVKNAALKKLFTDPHFNVMDGLDIYIDDYGIPDPLPAGMLQQMAQSRMLGLLTDTPAAPDKPATLETPVPADVAAADVPAVAPVGAPAAPHPTPPAQAIPDEDAALRLQPHHAAGQASTGEGAGPDTGRQC